jgi:hypothetical protein
MPMPGVENSREFRASRKVRWTRTSKEDQNTTTKGAESPTESTEKKRAEKSGALAWDQEPRKGSRFGGST